MDKNTPDIPQSPYVQKSIQVVPPGALSNPVHRAYGLRITHFARNAIAPPLGTIRPRQFTFYSLCHLLDGVGWFWLPGHEIVEVSPGQGILITPGIVFEYGGKASHWREDAVSFTGVVADQLQASGVIQAGMLELGQTRRLPLIIETAMDPSDDAQIEANSMLQQLLVDLYLARTRAKDTKADTIRALCRRIERDLARWWTIGDMAESCGMSVNHFRDQFQAVTGLRPKRWLEQRKMAHAAELLCQTTLGVGEIGEQLGYSDPFHFSRAFKRIIGQAPRTYRKVRR